MAAPVKRRKTSLCETDSPDTGEVALAPEGERCPEGSLPHRLRAEPPRRGGQGVNASFLTIWGSCRKAAAPVKWGITPGRL